MIGSKLHSSIRVVELNPTSRSNVRSLTARVDAMESASAADFAISRETCLPRILD